ncbi:hypothetical protein ZIOFF_006279 [Zingiber officinale]|uniref:Uncharacterized protein n=1 Tax=Zingiber officinale TaxID=94328 RepID=A0A8J5M2F2_ZINOF|nr:hypothetical protein ZIOFF_006279 [Zingiber officinale]
MLDMQRRLLSSSLPSSPSPNPLLSRRSSSLSRAALLSSSRSRAALLSAEARREAEQPSSPRRKAEQPPSLVEARRKAEPPSSPRCVPLSPRDPSLARETPRRVLSQLIFLDTRAFLSAELGLQGFVYLAAAYYYHGLILDEGNTEKSHGMAAAALQTAEEVLTESKKSCEDFHVMPPTSSQRAIVPRLNKKQHFSGSMIETNKFKERRLEGVPKLKRSSSFNEDRSYDMPCSIRESEKIGDSSQPKYPSGASKNISDLNSMSDDNATKISPVSDARKSSAWMDIPRLTSGARVIIVSRSDDNEDF